MGSLHIIFLALHVNLQLFQTKKFNFKKEKEKHKKTINFEHFISTKPNRRWIKLEKEIFAERRDDEWHLQKCSITTKCYCQYYQRGRTAKNSEWPHSSRKPSWISPPVFLEPQSAYTSLQLHCNTLHCTLPYLRALIPQPQCEFHEDRAVSPSLWQQLLAQCPALNRCDINACGAKWTGTGTMAWLCQQHPRCFPGSLRQ